MNTYLENFLFSYFDYLFENLFKNAISTTNVGAGVTPDLLLAIFLEVSLIIFVEGRQKMHWASSNFLERMKIISWHNLHHRVTDET